MRCEDLDNIIILALVLTVIGDLLGLYAEVVGRRCDEIDEAEQLEKENRINAELNDLRKRVALLEKKLGI